MADAPVPQPGGPAIPVRVVAECRVVRVQGPPDRRIAAVAATQHGRVARRQFLRAGVSDEQIAWRLARGLLAREHRGVYRVPVAPMTLTGRAAAALLTRGPEALLASHTAAALHGFRPELSDRPLRLLVPHAAGATGPGSSSIARCACPLRPGSAASRSRPPRTRS